MAGLDSESVTEALNRDMCAGSVRGLRGVHTAVNYDASAAQNE